MNNNDKKNSQRQKKSPISNTSPKEVHLGDGVLDVAKTSVNDRTQKIISLLINMLFDYIEDKVDNLPMTIKKLRDNPQTETEVVSLWSQRLYAQGIIPSGYDGLPDELLIHNFHQEGYLDGMYVGYLISMMVMAENGVSKDMILDTRKDILPKFFKKSYEDSKKLCQELEEEMHKWKEDSILSNPNIDSDISTNA